MFLFFFTLAFVILLITKLSKVYTNTIQFNIEKQNLSEEIILMNNTNKLNITLKAQGFNFLKYYIKKPSLNIDFKDDVIKKDTVFLWTKNKGFSSLIKQFNKNEEIITVNPDSLAFGYDSYSKKRIPIKLNYDINFKPGYNVLEKSFVLKPDSITIIGAESVVNSINSIETEILTLEDVNKDINTWVNLNQEQPMDLKFSDTKTKLNITVQKFTEGHLNIPIQVINKPSDITIKFYPKTVKLKYYTSLKSFSNITVKDFMVVCDYSTLSEGQNFMTPELVRQPENVKNIKIDSKKIEFIIDQK